MSRQYLARTLMAITGLDADRATPAVEETLQPIERGAWAAWAAAGRAEAVQASTLRGSVEPSAADPCRDVSLVPCADGPAARPAPAGA